MKEILLRVTFVVYMMAALISFPASCAYQDTKRSEMSLTEILFADVSVVILLLPLVINIVSWIFTGKEIVFRTVGRILDEN